MSEPTTPTVDMPLREALRELTGFEMLNIQRHYGLDLENLGGMRTLMGAIWAHENRREKTAWSTVENMTMGEMETYFAPEDPTGDQGKDLTKTQKGSPTSA